MDDEDDKLWDFVTKTVKPLRNKNVVPKDNLPAKKPSMASLKKIKKTVAIPPPQPLLSKDQTIDNSVDRRTAEKLRRGQMPIEGKLDLHGMGRVQAYEALHRFIEQSYQNGKRNLLVITGKGRKEPGSAPGILKQKVPEWLNSLNSIVLRTETARPKDGGEGALYVLLRRNRDVT